MRVEQSASYPRLGIVVVLTLAIVTVGGYFDA
jgi:hypothetical protein